jgi:hypothetical protein
MAAWKASLHNIAPFVRRILLETPQKGTSSKALSVYAICGPPLPLILLFLHMNQDSMRDAVICDGEWV